MSAPIETWSGPLGELRAASTAGGGTALTTAAALIALPDGATHLVMIPNNFATAKVVKFALNPYLAVLVTPNNLSTVTDSSQAAQDGVTSTVVDISALDTLANGDFVLVGARLPFRGLAATVVNANAIASVLTVKYWNGAWTAVSGLVDGTASAGATMAQTGNVTWTVPTDWSKLSMEDMQLNPGATVAQKSAPFYWLQLTVSAKLTNPTKLSSLLSLNRSTAYWEHISGQVFEERITKGINGISCVEALTDAGTANLIVNVATRYDAAFLS